MTTRLRNHHLRAMEVSTMLAHEITWEQVTEPIFETTTRQLWRETVAAIADKATATLPECASRVERARALVLAGDVALQADGTARVASQQHGRTQYLVVHGTCEHKDYQDQKAPRQLCKHRLAAAIARRAQELVKAKMGGQGAPETAPEAPATPAAADTTPAPEPVETPQGIPSQHVVCIQGKPFVRYADLLQMALERVLVTLRATWTFNDSELSLAHAVATFADGRRFEEAGDATPANTTRKVAVHFRRVALTRAKTRALRDALGVDLVSVEELGED
jgi:hypothetical protein